MEDADHLLGVLGAVGVVVLIASSFNLISRKLSIVPIPVLLVIVGIIISGFGINVLEPLRLNPSIVLFIYLPLLMFESAYKFEFREFRKVITPAFFFATVGLLIASVLLAWFMRLFIDVSWTDALLFSVVISSTDPIAILSVFKRINVPRKLELLIDAESLLSDATSIILFRFILGLAGAGATMLDVSTLMQTSYDFAYLLIVGSIVGIGLGLLFAHILDVIHDSPNSEIALTIILPVFSFAVAEHYFHASGFMAVLFSGLIIGNYGAKKISPSVTETMHHTWDMMIFFITALIFLMIGYEANLGNIISEFPVLFILTLGIVLSRSIAIYLLGPIYNLSVKQKLRIPASWLHIANLGGIRGLLPLVIILSLPDTFEYKQLFIELILFSIYFTMIFNSMAIVSLLNLLGMNKLNHLNRFEIKLSEFMILKRLLIKLNQLHKVGEISKEVYNRHVKETEESLKIIKKELNSKSLGNKDKIINIENARILRRYCLNIEASVYQEMFEKRIIDEGTILDLNLSITRQKEALDENLPQFKKSQSTFYDQVFKKQQRLNKKVRSKIKILSPKEEQVLKESYLYHKTRYMANYRVIQDLDNYSELNLNKNTENEIDKIRNIYQDLLKKNNMILASFYEQYPDLCKELDELCFYQESASLINEVIKEYGEQERFSLRALQNLKTEIKLKG